MYSHQLSFSALSMLKKNKTLRAVIGVPSDHRHGFSVIVMTVLLSVNTGGLARLSSKFMSGDVGVPTKYSGRHISQSHWLSPKNV